MSDAPALPPRPDPPRRLRDVAAAWWAWVGPVRVAATLVSIVVVVGGGYLLVRAPQPPPETTLPVTAASSPVSTLPPPVAAPAATVPDAVLVHVAGAVLRPGVHELAAGARIHSAIDAAGGATTDADLDGLNLAAPVIDGQRVYVPIAGEVDPATVPTLPPSLDVAGGATSGPVDLNRAAAAELETLPGIGPATAAAIVDDRARNGPFASVDELERVPGIGPAKLSAIRDLVTV